MDRASPEGAPSVPRTYMKGFDLIAIGGGSGLDVASAAASRGMDVAVVEKSPLGGTCLNRGCIPSKMLIHHADLAEAIANPERFGSTPRSSGSTSRR